MAIISITVTIRVIISIVMILALVVVTRLCLDAPQKSKYFVYFQSSDLAHSTDLDAAKTMSPTRNPQAS